MTDETLTPQHTSQEGLYGITPELVSDVKQALEDNNRQTLAALIEDLHAADVAELIGRLSPEDRKVFVEIIKDKLEPEVYTELEDQLKEEILDLVGTGSLAAAISELDSDDAIYVIEDMDQESQREVLKAIPAQERAILEEVLTYPEDSAGRLMQREIVVAPTFWTVAETIAFIRESSDLPDIFYNIFVVDPKHHPIGVIPLNEILKRDPETQISEIMDGEIKTIPVAMDQEEVAGLFQRYALVSAPVVDDSGRIVGMVTVDDVVDVIEEEAEEDIMHLSGVGESDFHAPVAKTAYWRSRWLFVTLINTLIAASVIAQFESSIKEKVALSFLMVIVAAMGGNAGMQTVTVTVRALATNELRKGIFGKSIIKEVLVSCVIGCAFAVFLGFVAYFWLHEVGVGIVLGVALIANMIWAGFAGTALPVLVQRMGMDPAISAGPLLSTTTDVLGYAIFLGIATYFLL
ncbi:MAG: magnesium transporter [Alphaproteobacteria bacterium]